MTLDGLRAMVIGELELSGPSWYESVGHHKVAQYEWPATLSPALNAPDSQAGDCQKRGALFEGRNGFDCLEAHIVDRLRSAAGRSWEAGWVQAWRCGRATWRDEIWDPLPQRLAAINSQVQDRRVAMRPGAKRSRLGGHPDIVVIDGDDILFIECKVNADGFDKQREWCEAAFDTRVIREAAVLIVHAQVLGHGREVTVPALPSRDLDGRPAESGKASRRQLDPALGGLLERAAEAPPGRRIEFRDEVAAYGPEAILAMETWVADGNSPGFAISVLEAVGHSSDPTGASRALRILRDERPSWSGVADEAIVRIQAAGRAPRARGTKAPTGAPYIATGTPPPAHGPCGTPNADGSACHNPGRHPVGNVMVCTTHYKALTRRGQA